MVLGQLIQNMGVLNTPKTYNPVNINIYDTSEAFVIKIVLMRMHGVYVIQRQPNRQLHQEILSASQKVEMDGNYRRNFSFLLRF